MPKRHAGFTLLEVLIALSVITVGLLGLAGTMGPITRLIGAGRAHGRAALVLASRADRLRAALLAAAPACPALGSGTLTHPDGVVESWTTSSTGSSIQVQIIAGADTLVTRLPCQ